MDAETELMPSPEAGGLFQSFVVVVIQCLVLHVSITRATHSNHQSPPKPRLLHPGCERARFWRGRGAWGAEGAKAGLRTRADARAGFICLLTAGTTGRCRGIRASRAQRRSRPGGFHPWRSVLQRLISSRRRCLMPEAAAEPAFLSELVWPA